MFAKKFFLLLMVIPFCLVSQDTQNIGISSENREKISALLNTILADEYTLFSRTLNDHWNVVGISFAEYHDFFKEGYKKMLDYTDDIAERIRALGGTSEGLFTQILNNTRFKPDTQAEQTDLERMQKQYTDQTAFIRNLRKDLETIRNLGDEGTANFLTDLMEKHEKLAWMIKSFNEKKSK